MEHKFSQNSSGQAVFGIETAPGRRFFTIVTAALLGLTLAGAPTAGAGTGAVDCASEWSASVCTHPGQGNPTSGADMVQQQLATVPGAMGSFGTGSMPAMGP